MGNSASRLKACIEKALQAPNTFTAIDAWSSVFGVTTEGGQRTHLVAARLSELSEQIELTRELMADAKYPAELYDPYLDRIAHAVNTPSLSGRWDQYSANLNEATLLSLSFCAELLDEEEEVDIEVLGKILGKIQELRSVLEKESLPIKLRTLVQKHLALMEDAITSYPVRGAAAVEDAFKVAFSDVVVHADVIADSSENDRLMAVKQLWGSLKTACDGIVTVNKAADALVAVWDKGGQFIEYVSNSKLLGN